MILKKFNFFMNAFRLAFSRHDAYCWFVLIVFGFIVRDDCLGVTSFIRAFGLPPSDYKNILNFFCYSSAYSADLLCRTWLSILVTNFKLHTIDEKIVLIADGLKIPKTGSFMPARRVYHQESANKPKFVMGHYFGAIGVLISDGLKYYCIPIMMKIQDGIRFAPNSKETLTSKMFDMISSISQKLKMCILCDAFFVAMKYVKQVKADGHDLIGRVKMSTVAYKIVDGTKQRIKLKELFENLGLFVEEKVFLYGKLETVKVYGIDLFYHGLTVCFVLTVFKNGNRAILMSTNTKLNYSEILQAYSLRFKIEVTFKTLIYSIGGFLYHFWTKFIKKIKRGQKNVYLHKASPREKYRIRQKLESYERFVIISCITMGILQIIALGFSSILRYKNPFYYRTMCKTGVLSELMVRKIIKEMYIRNFSRIMSTTVLGKVMKSKKCSKPGDNFWV